MGSENQDIIIAGAKALKWSSKGYRKEEKEEKKL